MVGRGGARAGLAGLGRRSPFEDRLRPLDVVERDGAAADRDTAIVGCVQAAGEAPGLLGPGLELDRHGGADGAAEVIRGAQATLEPGLETSRR